MTRWVDWALECVLCGRWTDRTDSDDPAPDSDGSRCPACAGRVLEATEVEGA